MSQVVVFHTDKRYGPVNGPAAFHPETDEMGRKLTPEDRKQRARDNKQKMGNQVGFLINNIAMLDHETGDYLKNPTTYTITPEDLEKYPDLFDHPQRATTIRVTPETIGVVAAYNLSGSPAVFGYNTKTGVITSTFYSGIHQNYAIGRTLATAVGGNPEDIMFTTSPFEHIITYKGNEEHPNPKYIQDEDIWNGYYEQTGQFDYLVNQRDIIIDQLIEGGARVENILMGEDITNNPLYPSTSRSNLNTHSKDNRFMSGIMYDPTDKKYNQRNIQTYKLKR